MSLAPARARATPRTENFEEPLRMRVQWSDIPMMASGCNEIWRSPPPLPRFSTVVWGMLAPVDDVSISII